MRRFQCLLILLITISGCNPAGLVSKYERSPSASLNFTIGDHVTNAAILETFEEITLAGNLKQRTGTFPATYEGKRVQLDAWNGKLRIHANNAMDRADLFVGIYVSKNKSVSRNEVDKVSEIIINLLTDVDGITHSETLWNEASK